MDVDNGEDIVQVVNNSGQNKVSVLQPSGYSGWSGTQGASGQSGTSGHSGVSGLNGDVAFSGDSGASGRSGASGYSGAPGSAIYSGASGSSGYSAPSGWSGWSGYSGFTNPLGQLEETVNSLGDISGTATIDLALGNVVIATVTGPVTLYFTGAVSGRSCFFTLILANAGNKVTWGSNVAWPNFGTLPSLHGNAVDILAFMTFNGGGPWYGVPSALGYYE